jgi:hypothetical protein
MNNSNKRISRAVVVLATLLLMAAGCKQDRRKLLLGKWHVVKFENNFQMLVGKWNAVSVANADLDSFFARGQKYIDTVGKNNDAATNMKLYGVTNMDSMRVILQAQYDSAKLMQQQAITTTSFYFGEEGLAVLSFHGSVDTSGWYIDSTGTLVLADMNAATKGEKLELEIVTVSDSLLKLKFRENNANSIVTFRPEGDREKKTRPEVETYFNFRPDSVVGLSFNGGLDSNKWYLENDSVITVRSLDKAQAGTMKWDILSLSEKKMQLKIVESSSVSVLTFDKEAK